MCSGVVGDVALHLDHLEQALAERLTLHPRIQGLVHIGAPQGYFSRHGAGVIRMLAGEYARSLTSWQRPQKLLHQPVVCS